MTGDDSNGPTASASAGPGDGHDGTRDGPPGTGARGPGSDGATLNGVAVARRVGVDTSALMAPVEAGVRLFEELDRHLDGPVAVVPTPVVGELRSLSTGAGEAGTAAGVGLELLDRCITVETDATYADDALVELAREGRVGQVVTNDRPLRDRLLDAGVPVLCVRGRTELLLTRP